jgi:quercetin dioxygenase-like cupin family protein
MPIAAHQHPHEQIVWMIKGKMRRWSPTAD